MAVASNSDLYESTQQIYCNKQPFMESERGDEGLLRVLKAYCWAGKHFSLSVPPWRTGGLSLSLRLMVMTSSVLLLKHLGDFTIISTSGLQLLLGLSRFQERGQTDASPLCSGCSLVNIFRQNQNNEVQHDVFLILLLYFSSYFLRKCWYWRCIHGFFLPTSHQTTAILSLSGFAPQWESGESAEKQIVCIQLCHLYANQC